MSRTAAAFCVLMLTSVGGHGAALPDTVTAAMQRSRIAPASFSAYVHEIGPKHAAPILAYNADVPRNPASTIKLVTTWVALEALGPTYTWRTEALSAAVPRNGVLDGDLYLKGGGDPWLVLERFWLLVRGLRQRGVREIDGEVIIDNSYFDIGATRAGDFDGRPYSTYNVVPDALLVNFQAVDFRFRPDPVGNRVEITADPLPANLKIRNQIQLVDGACGGTRNRINFTVSKVDGGDQATFTGRFSRRCAEYRVTRSLMNSADYTYGLFRTLWEESGGVLRRGYRLQTTPDSGVKTLVSLDSLPLTDIITAVNKHSNNVMARHLLLTLGAERFGAPGTVEKGQRVVSAEVARLGLDFPELVIGNGAGLARDTRISARSLGELLRAAADSPFASEFESSLALAGLDGTMRRRFRGDPAAGHMHLKSGTLNNVRAVAGYVQAPSGRKFAVVVIQNSSAWGDEAQAALLRWVYRQ